MQAEWLVSGTKRTCIRILRSTPPPTGSLCQSCSSWCSGSAHRNDQPATGRELLQERRRHFLGSRRDQDGIIGGRLRPAVRAVAGRGTRRSRSRAPSGRSARPDSSGTISIVRTVLARGAARRGSQSDIRSPFPHSSTRSALRAARPRSCGDDVGLGDGLPVADLEGWSPSEYGCASSGTKKRRAHGQGGETRGSRSPAR